jgi:hypothetical protein
VAKQTTAAINDPTAPVTSATVSKTTTEVAKATIKPANTTGNSKAPKSGEEVCALLTKEEASTVLGLVVDKMVPGSTTGYSCDYYVGEKLILQVFFEKVKGSKSLVDSDKFIYPDATLISGVGDYNWWSAESGRFELFQGSSNFDIVILSGEADKTKLLEQATKVAQLVISQL